MKEVKLREFEMSDWEAAWQLWQKELGKSTDDSWDREKVESFLERNPGLSFVAMVDGSFAGTVMCGFDGRRGYVYHLAVAEGNKRKGIGTALMQIAVSKLKDAGAGKIHLMVFVENECAQIFYNKLGFQNREDVTLMSSINI